MTRRERWLDAALPYAKLMRLDKPIGIWLLLLPCWWGIALEPSHAADMRLLFLFALGAIVMRSAGCIVNDLYDRELDAKVERTRDRPLASGKIKPWQAIVLLIALLAIGLGILVQFNHATVVLGLSSLALIALYPLMKRVTWWPQLFLGLTFNWGALMGWTAANGSLTAPAVFLYIGGVFWTLGYDTIYAYQDVRDDAAIGIKSTARLFGDNGLPWIMLFYALAIAFIALAGWKVLLGTSFYLLLLTATVFICVQLALWKRNDPANCLRRFRANRDFGLIVFAAIMLGKFL